MPGTLAREPRSVACPAHVCVATFAARQPMPASTHRAAAAMDEAELRTCWQHALGGDRAALRTLVMDLGAVVRCRVARSLLRLGGAARGRDLRQETTDLAQDVMVALFSDDLRALRAWDPERGMGLRGFVGLLAEREVASILRSRRRSPFSDDPTPPEDLEALAPRRPDPEAHMIDRDLTEKLLVRLREELSPLGWRLFLALWRDQQEVDQLVTELDMTSEAIWAWRSRIRKRALRLRAELSHIDDDDLATKAIG
jgi:hypothetical protein